MKHADDSRVVPSVTRRYLGAVVIGAMGLFALACDGPHSALVSSQGEKKEAAAVDAHRVVEFDLASGASESTATSGFFPLPATRSYTGLVRAIERTYADRNTRAIFVRLGSRRLEWAKVEELASLFASLKARAPVYCHAHSLSNATLWLTLRGCSKTWLSPAGDVDAIGLSTQLIYFKSLLDKLGIKADFLSVGKYKSAAESFLRDEPSDAAREEWLETLGSIRNQWLAAIREARPAALQSLETGPYGAQAALAHKLVDAIGDEGEVSRAALQLGNSKQTHVAFGADHRKPAAGSAISELLALLSGVDDGASRRPHIAVVPLTGAITMGSDGLFEAEGITERAVAHTIDRLIDDDMVRAVVLRIDSPGGSALASDLMWSRLRELGRRKLLITSVGSMAASGGYYLACAGSRIFSASTSIVGSIGVVGGKLAIGPALEPWGVHTVTLSPGADPHRAAYESPLLPWDDSTRAQVHEQMRSVYDLFVSRVAIGRNLSREKVLEVAEGRVFSGRQGLDLGLVDEIGGLSEALEWARSKAHLDAGAPVSVEGLGDGLLSALGLDAEASLSEFSAAVERQRSRLFAPLNLVPSSLLPWVSGITPLLSHERVLVLSPLLTVEP